MVTFPTNLLDHRQYPRFPIIISISSHTEIDLLVERVGFVSTSEFEDPVGRGRKQMEGKEGGKKDGEGRGKEGSCDREVGD